MLYRLNFNLDEEFFSQMSRREDLLRLVRAFANLSNWMSQLEDFNSEYFVDRVEELLVSEGSEFNKHMDVVIQLICLLSSYGKFFDECPRLLIDHPNPKVVCDLFLPYFEGGKRYEMRSLLSPRMIKYILKLPSERKDQLKQFLRVWLLLIRDKVFTAENEGIFVNHPNIRRILPALQSLSQ